jgi:hypothetical protein
LVVVGRLASIAGTGQIRLRVFSRHADTAAEYPATRIQNDLAEGEIVGGGHGKGIEVILPLWHAVFKKIFLL